MVLYSHHAIPQSFNYESVATPLAYVVYGSAVDVVYIGTITRFHITGILTVAPWQVILVVQSRGACALKSRAGTGEERQTVSK